MNQFILKLRILLLSSKFYYILLFVFTIYAFLYTNNANYKSVYKENETCFEMIITNYKIDGNKLSIQLLSDEKIIGSYYFETEKEKNEFIRIYSIGDKIIINGELNKPKKNTIPNTFNYRVYLKNKRIFYLINIDSYHLLKKNHNILYKIKDYVYKRISKIDNNEYVYALVLGEMAYVDDESYRMNGVSHLFSLSGLHVSLLSVVLLKIINIFSKKKETNIINYLIIFLFLILFSFVTGFKPSLLKAVLFFILSGINKVYYLHIKGHFLLVVAYIFLIIINPFYIYDLSFILSLTITFFLLYCSENINSKKYFINLFLTSLLSLLSSIPILINNFYQINILSLINNLFFVPFVSFIIYPVSILTFIFPFINEILKFLIIILENISNILSKINILTITFISMSYIEIIVYYVLLILLIKSKKKIKYILMLLILFNYMYFKINFDKKTYLYFLDVGQGDSALIRTKNGKSILIDTGGKLEYTKEEWMNRTKEFNLMESSIIPFFRSIGVKKIDYFFLTHGDDDHGRYSENLINAFKVKNTIINNGEVNKIESKLKYNRAKNTYKIDNVKIYSLNDDDYKDENRNSLILLIIIDNKKILMMGDASKKEEENIIKKFDLSDVFILKVGHHGSKTSSDKDFINNTRPKYSIISAGENNKFGHPNKNVVELLEKYHSKIYITYESGTIKYVFNKKSVNIFEHKPY